jgi:hypothetical protein
MMDWHRSVRGTAEQFHANTVLGTEQAPFLQPVVQIAVLHVEPVQPEPVFSQQQARYRNSAQRTHFSREIGTLRKH